LPADFDVALQGVDTRLKALNPATTLGDLNYASATANTNTRLGIGTSGQVLAVSGGGVPAWTTPATPASGFNLISNQALSSQTSINFNSCFSATYRNYKVLINLTSTATDPIRMRLRSGSTDATGANYNLQYSEVDGATAGGFRLSGETSFRFSPVRSSGTTFVELDINNPFIAAATSITGSGIDPANPNYNAYTENHTLATSYDGFTVFAATYNLTGNVAVYGYGA
jgi:hypothetical protein